MFPLDAILMSSQEDAVGARVSRSAHNIHRLQHTVHEQMWCDCLHKCSAVPLTFILGEITMMGYQTTTNHSNQLYSPHLRDLFSSSDKTEENHLPQSFASKYLNCNQEN